jgi:3,4-dihydroxy 2-butanone 4-phosphate synthase/GTP cyclohydrolase II
MAIELDDEVELPTVNGPLPVRWAGDDAHPGVEVVLARVGELEAVAEPLVRIHSECLTGEVFGSGRCDCGAQMAAALEAMRAEGAGVLAYVRGHEGRGIGLRRKLAAYRLQDRGSDTFAANRALGLPDDDRRYEVPAAALAALGLRRVRLLTENPHKVAAVRAAGLAVVATPFDADAPVASTAYVQAKRLWFVANGAAG